jgi:two-component system, response regulator RegA
MTQPPSQLGLLVDDDALYLRTLQRSLQKRGVATVAAQNFTDALAAAEVHRPDFALIDLKLGNDSGLGLIEPLRDLREDMTILLVTGYASIATAVEAIKRGADNYLLKPVTAEAILRALAGEPDKAVELESTMVPLSRVEWEHIQQALNETEGNISAAARLLGMHRRSLQRKLAKRPGPERRITDESE